MQHEADRHGRDPSQLVPATYLFGAIDEAVVLTAAISGRVSREAASGTPRSYPLDFGSFVQTSAEVIEAGAAGTSTRTSTRSPPG